MPLVPGIILHAVSPPQVLDHPGNYAEQRQQADDADQDGNRSPERLTTSEVLFGIHARVGVGQPSADSQVNEPEELQGMFLFAIRGVGAAAPSITGNGVVVGGPGRYLT